MGDTGSMFLGGAVIAMAFGVDYPLLIVLSGIIYFIEAASVVIQVSFFKLTKLIFKEGKRIFKMTPIHHHFEMCEYSEIGIVVLFSFVTIIGCVASVFAVVSK